MSRTLSLALLALFLALIVGAIPAANEQTPLSPSDPHAAYSWSWNDCGLATDIVQIKTLSLSPDPPKPGQNLTVHATGHVSETINKGAYADVSVKLGLIKLLQKEFDICEEAAKANVSLQCPVQPGDEDITHTVALPRQIPPAKFIVEVRGYNNDDANLMCARIEIDFIPSLSSSIFGS